MNFKMIVLGAVAALMMGACVHKNHAHQCGGECSMTEAKKECASKECPLDGKKCADCQKVEEKTSK